MKAWLVGVKETAENTGVTETGAATVPTTEAEVRERPLPKPGWDVDPTEEGLAGAQGIRSSRGATLAGLAGNLSSWGAGESNPPAGAKARKSLSSHPGKSGARGYACVRLASSTPLWSGRRRFSEASGCRASLGARERSSRIALRSRSQVLGTLCLEKSGEPPLLQKKRTFLVIQWLRLCSPNAEGPGQIPGQETRSHMPPLRPDAAK